MAEYVTKEQVIDWYRPYGQTDEPIPFETLVSDLRDMKTSDVSTVLHGQWEPGNPICPVCGENKFKDLDADIWCDWLPDYCPNCGADMRGSKDE